MNPPPADWYPDGLQPPGARVERRTPLDTPFHHVALTPGSARTLAVGLRERAAMLRTLPLERILSALDRVCLWRGDDKAYLELIGPILQAIGCRDTLGDAHLLLQMEALRRPHLERWLEASGIRPGWLDGVLDEARTLVFGPRLTLVVSSGNVLGASLPSIIQALLLKSPVLVKTSAGEPAFLPVWAELLAKADPEVASAVAVAHWEGGDVEAEDAVLAEVDALVAYGADATLRALRGRLPAHARFIGYGHRISFSAVGRERLNRASLFEVGRSIARDFFCSEEGCLTPQALYLEEGGELSPERFVEELSRTLGRHAVPYRRELTTAEFAGIHQLRGRMEMASLLGTGPRIWSSDEEPYWTLVLDPDPSLGPKPAKRFIVARSLPDLSQLPQAVASLGPALISCSLDVAEDRKPTLIRALASAGVTRFASTGKAQQPEDALLHDGVNALSALARFVRVETH